MRALILLALLLAVPCIAQDLTAATADSPVTVDTPVTVAEPAEAFCCQVSESCITARSRRPRAP
jgi:hypothetical protein